MRQGLLPRGHASQTRLHRPFSRSQEETDPVLQGQEPPSRPQKDDRPDVAGTRSDHRGAQTDGNGAVFQSRPIRHGHDPPLEPDGVLHRRFRDGRDRRSGLQPRGTGGRVGRHDPETIFPGRLRQQHQGKRVGTERGCGGSHLQIGHEHVRRPQSAVQLRLCTTK